jgi:hypothetical protein
VPASNFTLAQRTLEAEGHMLKARDFETTPGGVFINVIRDGTNKVVPVQVKGLECFAVPGGHHLAEWETVAILKAVHLFYDEHKRAIEDAVAAFEGKKA